MTRHFFQRQSASRLDYTAKNNEEGVMMNTAYGFFFLDSTATKVAGDAATASVPVSRFRGRHLAEHF